MTQRQILERLLRFGMEWEIKGTRIPGDPMVLIQRAYGAIHPTADSVARQAGGGSIHNRRAVARTVMGAYATLAQAIGVAETISPSALVRALKGLIPSKPVHGRAHPETLRPIALRRHETSPDTRTLDEMIYENETGRVPNPVLDIEGF